MRPLLHRGCIPVRGCTCANIFTRVRDSIHARCSSRISNAYPQRTRMRATEKRMRRHFASVGCSAIRLCIIAPCIVLFETKIIFPLEREPPVDHCIVERRWTISIRAGRNNSPWVVKWFNRFFFFSREGSVKKFLRLEIRHYLPFNRNASPSFYRVDFFWNALSFSFLFQRLWEREREKNTVTFWIYFKVTLLR